MAMSMALLLTAGASAAVSDEIHILTNPYPPAPITSSGGIQPFGAKPPGSSATVHDLSLNAYNYRVQKIGYQVFTEKWVKGASKIKVSVSNWSVDLAYAGTNNQLTISIYDSKKKLVASDTIDPNKSSSVTFSNLSSSSNYYVGFSVPNNGNEYSFNGSISKN